MMNWALAWRRSIWPLGLTAFLALAAFLGPIALLWLAGVDPAFAATAAYPAMAPVSEYLMADKAAEIALARSAAPASVSGDAEVLVLGPKGYVSAGPGKNGFVCMVQRAWFSGLEDPGFWNPKLRAPVCYNAQSARSVMPTFLTRTEWALAGVSRPEILARTRAAMASGKIPAPETGSFTFMLSKHGYLGDGPHGPWRPHVMFYFAPALRMADWGANLPGSPVFGDEAGGDPWTMFYVPVPAWSDGSPDEHAGAKHAM